MHTIQIRIDQKTKQSANKVLDKLGLDMSSAVKIYLRQITRTKGIPFSIVTEDCLTPVQKRKMIEESNRTMRLYKQGKIKAYSSAREMMKDILS